MKLQIAFDLIDREEVLDICSKVKDYVDLIEIGTPLVKYEGLKFISEFKNFGKEIVADLKTMDVGFMEAEMAFSSGADIMTVCGCSDIATVQGAIDAGKKYSKKVMVDLISVSDVSSRAKEFIDLGADFVCIHTGIDMQHKGMTPFEDLEKVTDAIGNDKVAIAGGINEESVEKIIKYEPAIVIVGGAITGADNPMEIAKLIKEKLK